MSHRISSSSKKEQLKLKNQTFSYSEVLNITNGFEIMIGKGGFGEVYLGTLQSGERVAVKKLSLSSNQGYKEFKSEAKFLTLVHHRNVVSLVGYCDEGDAKALIYEYLSKGNLQEQLSDKSSSVLGWKERVQIALDAASGLDYLHNGCKPPIIHRDLKGSNILVDENMHAKISDFGLSRTFANDSDTHVLTNYPGGTPGYIDPEYHYSGILNKRSDVYSFGVILLELITGQPAIRGTPEKPSHIHSWVKSKLEAGDIQAIVDPRLEGNYHVASAWKFLDIAMSCLPHVAIQRPDISHITSELKDCLSLEVSLQRTASNNVHSFLVDSMLIDFNESDIGPNPRDGARYQYPFWKKRQLCESERCSEMYFFKEACMLGDRDSAQMAHRSTNMETHESPIQQAHHAEEAVLMDERLTMSRLILVVEL
ncbi:hypothetical protein VNO80_06533 [Phaseolus coccineus]|uniref:Protein kinase domain-containing protein n=1 Tax=Phaseolus coccineus TaxID=3886 RepID=A0AAN9NII3_PHACN